MSRGTAFPTRLRVRPARTQISLRGCAGWSESSLFTWRRNGSLTTYSVLRKDSHQTARMHSLTLVLKFAGHTCNLVGNAVHRRHKAVGHLILDVFGRPGFFVFSYTGLSFYSRFYKGYNNIFPWSWLFFFSDKRGSWFFSQQLFPPNPWNQSVAP